MLALLAGLACNGCGPAPSSSVDESWLFDRLKAVAVSDVPSQSLIVKSFDLPPSCLGSSCRFTIAPNGGQKYTGSLRRSPEGIIFEIDGFAGQHIQQVAVQKRFRTTAPEEGCCDAPCWYLNSYNDWGLMAFGVDRPASKYINSVVINTEEYGRMISAKAKSGANVR
jgi:hypothetical protein